MNQLAQPTHDSEFARRLIESAFRHRKLLLGVMAVVLLPTIAYILFAPRRYESEMKLLMQNARGNDVITANESNAAMPEDITEEQINSELEVLQSQDVLGRVGDPGWDPSQTAGHTPDEIKAHELKVTQLSKRLGIQAIRKTNVIEVTSTGPTPAQATQTLEAVEAAYMAKRKVLSRPRGETGFFVEEANRYKADWEAANEQLVEFQRQHQLVSIPEVEDNLQRQINDVDDQLRSTASGLAESSQKLHESSAELGRVATRQTTLQRRYDNQYSIEQMQTTLLALQNKRAEMSTRYRTSDPLVKELDAQIAQTQDALKAAQQQRGEDDTTDVNPVWQQLKGDVALEHVNRSALLGRQADLQRARAGLVANLAATQQMATTYAALKARADEAQNNFKMFTEKRDQAEIEDAMDEHQLVNVSVAESPTTSYKPASPRPLQSLVLAMLTAFFLAAGAVYAAEVARSTVATARELEAVSAHPALASLPYDPEEQRNPQVLGKAARSLITTDGLNVYPSAASLASTMQRSGAATEQ